jgi:SAM-dependent methyltransferase
MEQYLARLHRRFRERRADLFVRLMAPPPNVSVLDLGSGSGTFSRLIAERCSIRLTMADVLDHSDAAAKIGASFVRVAETGALPFADREFDVVLCNSVIEHATDPACVGQSESLWRSSAWQVQKAFASEIRRIGKAYFVQTPHRDFPFDMHLWLPFTNWVAHHHLCRLRPLFDKYGLHGCDQIDWSLLRTGDMRRLFPDAGIHVERVAGIPKSIVAFRRFVRKPTDTQSYT